MPRQSQFANLKPEVTRLFLAGMTASEVRDRYPQIPFKTVYRWRDEALSNTTMETTSDCQSSDAITVTAEVVPNPSKLVPLPAGEESDYQLARRTVRGVLKSSEAPAHTKILAVGALVKLIEMRYNLPAHILDESTKSSVDEQRDRIRDLPPDEIARRYREAL